MLKIKLVRTGKRNSPSYRIAVQEAKQKVKGLVNDNLGYVIPKEDGNHEFVLDQKKYDLWLKKGAQPTASVLELIAKKYSYKKYSPKKEQGEETPLDSSKTQE